MDLYSYYEEVDWRQKKQWLEAVAKSLDVSWWTVLDWVRKNKRKPIPRHHWKNFCKFTRRDKTVKGWVRQIDLQRGVRKKITKSKI